MDLDEAIRHAQWVADTNCDQCAEDHRQLVEWLKELKKLRRLSWHPASKLPPKSTRIIVCYKDKDNYDLYTSQSSFLTKTNEYIGVPEYAQKTLKWCYPPKGD